MLNYNGRWFNLEGFILDVTYLNKLQEKFKECNGSFCGYGVATNDFKNPPIEWNGCQGDGSIGTLRVSIEPSP